jgi:RNA polymerase sigma-70 factor (ECF subfamily)
LDKLKPEYREIIVLKMLEGLSHAEIAQQLGKKEGTSRVMLARALAALTIAYRED